MQENYKRTLYLYQIIPFIDKPVIKVITGVRRSGKSFIMKQLISMLSRNGVDSNQIVYINKELVKFDFITNYKDLHGFITEKFKETETKKYLLIDEIQEIVQWEKAIVSFFAEDNYDIFITGSNAKLLSSEIATLLSGRYVEFNVFPLSFNEFKHFINNGQQSNEDTFYLYLKYGGFPVIHHFNMDKTLIYQYINSLYSTILLKDIISRFNVRNVQLFENLAKYVFNNIGSIFSGRSISKYLKSQKISVGLDTIQNYLQYLENSFLVYKVKRYDLKGKRILELYEKYYLSDIAFKNAILGYKEQDINGMLENIVYLKLCQNNYNVHIGKYNDYEIDFIAEKANNRYYIQVAYLLHSEETIEREFRVLKLIPDNYPKYVLSMDKYGTTNNEGIIRMNIIDFIINFK